MNSKNKILWFIALFVCALAVFLTLGIIVIEKTMEPKIKAVESKRLYEVAPKKQTKSAPVKPVSPFRIVNAEKYKEDDYEYEHYLPVLLISIENTGQTPITSRELDCDISFLDIDNKRIIMESGLNLLNEFNTIELGYTTAPIAIDIDIYGSEPIVSVIGKEPIDFDIKVKVTCKLNKHIEKYETIFSPHEYPSLPLWE
jgi:hypothetical protein